VVIIGRRGEYDKHQDEVEVPSGGSYLFQKGVVELLSFLCVILFGFVI